MVERTLPMAEELPSAYEAEMNGDKYVLHTLSSPYRTMQQIGDCFLNEVDAIVANDTYANNMDIRKIEVHKDEFEQMMVEGRVFDSSTHSVVYNQIKAIKSNATPVNSDYLGRAKDFFKDIIAENPRVGDALEHTFDFNLPTAEAARIIVNLTPSLSNKVINERAEKSAELEYLRPANIIDRASQYISADALLNNIDSIPEHKTSVIRDNLTIDGKVYSAEIFLDHDPMFIGTPDDGDINMSIEAIAVFESKSPGSDSASFVITGNDARSLKDTVFNENDGLEQEAMTHCVNTSPELHDILERYREVHPEAEVKLANSYGR
jgi:hypothetical protein